jgi:hypothetical protein
MSTAYITIGNSDNKLTQAQWSEFRHAVDLAVSQAAAEGACVQFHGYSLPAAPWQNAMWAIELPDDLPLVRQELRHRVAQLAWIYNQDSIAWAQADVEFLAGKRVTGGGVAELTIPPLAVTDI